MWHSRAAAAFFSLALLFSGCHGPDIVAKPQEESGQSAPSGEQSESAQPRGEWEEFARMLLDDRSGELKNSLDEWLTSHRDGTFSGEPSRHAPYPEDFPPAENLPTVEEAGEIAVAWREAEKLDERSESPGTVCVILPADESHICILEPALLYDSDGEASLAISGSGFACMGAAEYVRENKLDFELL